MPSIASLFRPSAISVNASIRASVNHSQGPHRLDFSPTWDNPKCPTRAWYEGQPCTKFHFLQYRKDRKKPFYHEFIVLELDNGTFCRFDRRRDNESPETGRAEDSAQVLHPAECTHMNRSSNLLLRLHFPRGQDLKHILTTCRAMQNGRGKDYSLMDYNCYFFAWTIVLVSARRMAHWGFVEDFDAAIRRMEAIESAVHGSECAPYLLSVMSQTLSHATHILNSMVRDSIFRSHITPLIRGFIDTSCNATILEAIQTYALGAAQGRAPEAIYEPTWRDILSVASRGKNWEFKSTELVNVMYASRSEPGGDLWASIAAFNPLIVETTQSAFKTAWARAREVQERFFGVVSEGVAEHIIEHLPTPSPDELKVELQLHDLVTSLTFYSTEVTMAGLQEYMQKRIANHCRKCLVNQEDIEQVMTDVWRAVMALG